MSPSWIIAARVLTVRDALWRIKGGELTVELFCRVLESNRLLERIPYVKDVWVEFQFLWAVDIILVIV